MKDGTRETNPGAGQSCEAGMLANICESAVTTESDFANLSATF